MICPDVPNRPGSHVESPAVPKAEAISKLRRRKLPSCTVIGRKSETIANSRLTMGSASTFITSSVPMVRPNTIRYWWRRKNAMVASTSTMNVVTLMPPAVDVLPPPISISDMVKSAVSSRIAAVSMVLNPAVRGVTP